MRRTTSGTVEITTARLDHSGLPAPSREGSAPQISARPRTSSSTAIAASASRRHRWLDSRGEDMDTR